MSDELIEGEKYVVSLPPVRYDGDPASRFEMGQVVTITVGTPDHDGEVRAVPEGSSSSFYLMPEGLVPLAEFEASEHSPDCPNADGEEIEYLPDYASLPLGYVMGLMAYMENLGRTENSQ